MIKERKDQQDMEVEISLVNKDGKTHTHWFLNPEEIKSQLARLEESEKRIEIEMLKQQVLAKEKR